MAPPTHIPDSNTGPWLDLDVSLQWVGCKRMRTGPSELGRREGGRETQLTAVRACPLPSGLTLP